MIERKRNHLAVWAAILVVLMLAIACMFAPFVGMAAKADDAESDGIGGANDATSAEDVGYYMWIDMQGVTLSLTCASLPSFGLEGLILPFGSFYSSMITDKKFMQYPQSGWGEFKAFSRQDKNATVIFRFPNIRLQDPNIAAESGNPLLVQCVCGINFPGSQTVNNDVKFNGTTYEGGRIKVNLRKEYYDIFMEETEKGNDLSFYTTLYWRGRGILLHNTAIHAANKCADGCRGKPERVTLETGPAGDGALDNGGSDGAGIKPSDNFDSNFFTWFLSIWGSSNPSDIAMQILFVALGLFLVFIIVKIILK